MKKVLGILILLASLLGLILAIAGGIFAPTFIDTLATTLNSNLDLTSQSLGMVEETLLLAKSTLDEMSAGLDTMTGTAVDATRALSGNQPLLGEIAQIVSQDVPDGLDAVQASVPGMAEAAGIVDDTLLTLTKFRVDRTILGFPIRFDLGINYNPEVTFEEAVNQITDSLADISPRLRNLQIYLDDAEVSLEAITKDSVSAIENLKGLSVTLAQAKPLLDGYLDMVVELQGMVVQTRSALEAQLNTIKLAAIVSMVWLGLTQAALLYLGWELVTSRRNRD